MYFYEGDRKWQILHYRLRLEISDIHCQTNPYILFETINYGHYNEDPEYFLLFFPLCNGEHLIHLARLNNLTINTLVSGDPVLKL